MCMCVLIDIVQGFISFPQLNLCIFFALHLYNQRDFIKTRNPATIGDKREQLSLYSLVYV